MKVAFLDESIFSGILKKESSSSGDVLRDIDGSGSFSKRAGEDVWDCDTAIELAHRIRKTMEKFDPLDLSQYIPYS